MGISNTTTATAVITALSDSTVEQTTGKGAGLTKALFEHKKEILKKALKMHYDSQNTPFEIVQKMGGFDIAGLMGCFLGAAYYRIPIVIDGVISISAALAAYCTQNLVKDYVFVSHHSAEPAYSIAAEKMKLRPYFELDMRLGEGTGCPFTMYLADAATKIVREMATFEQGNVDKSNYIDIRKDTTA